MTINQLKAELEAREESKSARKPELQRRLRALIVDARMREQDEEEGELAGEEGGEEGEEGEDGGDGGGETGGATVGSERVVSCRVGAVAVSRHEAVRGHVTSPHVPGLRGSH